MTGTNPAGRGYLSRVYAPLVAVTALQQWSADRMVARTVLYA